MRKLSEIQVFCFLSFSFNVLQIDKICQVANKPLVVTYTGLMQACLESGDVENGAYIFNHMQKFCSPNLVTCNIMLKAFLDHGRFEEAKQLFLKLLENGNSISREEDYKVKVIPDIYTFNTMLDACAVGKKWDDLEFAYTQMLRYGNHFNAKRHLRLIFDARRAGKVLSSTIVAVLFSISSEIFWCYFRQILCKPVLP